MSKKEHLSNFVKNVSNFVKNVKLEGGCTKENISRKVHSKLFGQKKESKTFNYG